MSKKKKTNKRAYRIKLAAAALVAVLAGGLLLSLSIALRPVPDNKTQEASATQPAEPLADPTLPSDPTPDPIPTAPGPAPERQEAVDMNMSGLLLLFSMVGFVLAVLLIGLIVYDIYTDKPAWQTQTKYPKRDRS